MRKTLVSVIIPSKNRPDYVIQALDSVLAQTYKNIEIIVVDDGSTTPLEPLLRERYGRQLAFVRHEQSLGASAARNAGAQYSSGEFVAFLDDDDLWLPCKIEKQMKIFLDLTHDYGVVYCGYDFLVESKTIERNNKYCDSSELYPLSLKGCPVGSPTPIIRKSFFNTVGGFDVDLKALEDWAFWIKLSKVCRFHQIKESLALYRVHGAQITSSVESNINARVKIFKKYKDDFIAHPEILSRKYGRTGALYSILGDEKRSKAFYRLALACDKNNYNAHIHNYLIKISPKLDKYLTEYFGITRVGGVRLIH